MAREPRSTVRLICGGVRELPECVWSGRLSASVGVGAAIKWKFTRDKLAALVDRLDQPADESSLPLAA
jgi:hypothetical protein